MRRLISLAIAAVPLLGCKPELPSLDYRGERVRVGSDAVDQVCAGTLARMDREVEQIESRLNLPIQESRLDVYVVGRELIEAHCSMHGGGCAPTRQGETIVVVEQQSFERSIAHELVHARLAASRSTPLFTEGIAEAVSLPTCPRPAPDIGVSEILAANKAQEWRVMRDAYYAAEELVAWLLEEFGAGEVLSLMRSIPKGSSAATTKAKYRERFDRELADDFLARLRTQADLDTLPPEHFGCFTAPTDPSQGPVQLVADLDCDSDRVHNNFGIDGSGYVEWTLHLDHTQTLELVGEVPFGTSLTIEECRCLAKLGEDEYLLARPFGTREILQPGAYRLRWVGALDDGLSLDVELVSVED